MWNYFGMPSTLNYQDPMAAYSYASAGIPQNYTSAMEGLGYLGNPYGSVLSQFQDMSRYQSLLKNMLDTQLGSFNNGNNINALPLNMRSIFTAAAPILTDPVYGNMGAQGMLSNGWQMGALPNNLSMAGTSWNEQAQGYPHYPAPSATMSGGMNGGMSGQSASGGSSGGSGGGGGTLVGSYSVPLQGGGSMTVNASDPAAAQENAKQGGNMPDYSQAPTTNRAPQQVG